MKILRVKRIKQEEREKTSEKSTEKFENFWKKKKKKKNLFFFCHLSEQARLLSNKWKRKLRSENEKIPNTLSSWKMKRSIYTYIPYFSKISYDQFRLIKKLIKRYNKVCCISPYDTNETIQ